MLKKLLVISVDALMYGDLKKLSVLPTFRRIMEGSSIVKQMTTIYPSLTLPAHVAIATGCYPITNGVNHNEATLLPGKDQPWNWYVDIVKVPFFWDEAKKAGYTTASIGWPVNGHAKADYVMPDIWTLDVEEDPTELFTEAGAANIIDTVFNKNKHLMDWNYHPKYDQFVAACAADVVRQYGPDIMFMHVSPVDDFRHKYGTYSEKVDEAFVEVDREIAEVIAAYEECGYLDMLDIAVLGDHGHLQVEKQFCPNVLLAQEGLIRVEPDGKIHDWDVFCRSCGLSSTVYLKDSSDQQLYERVYSLLKGFVEIPEYGVSEVLTREEGEKRWHVSGEYAFILETDGHTAFGVEAAGDVVIQPDNSDYKFAPSSHGYMPDKGDKPPFIVKGPSFKREVVLESAQTIDIAPTLAKAYDFCMSRADGKSLDALLK